MDITIFYNKMLNTGYNYETLENISNFQEKSYGVSFKYAGRYVLFPYYNISSFALSEDDKNDS